MLFKSIRIREIQPSGELNSLAFQFNKWVPNLVMERSTQFVRKEKMFLLGQKYLHLLYLLSDPIKQIVDNIYTNLQQQMWNVEYLGQRAILTPLNDIVDEINNIIIHILMNLQKNIKVLMRLMNLKYFYCCLNTGF